MCVFISPLVFSSISLDLLPERAATLMVYEDVVEIVPGLQGEHTVCVCVQFIVFKENQTFKSNYFIEIERL